MGEAPGWGASGWGPPPLEPVGPVNLLPDGSPERVSQPPPEVPDAGGGERTVGDPGRISRDARAGSAGIRRSGGGPAGDVGVGAVGGARGDAER